VGVQSSDNDSDNDVNYLLTLHNPVVSFCGLLYDAINISDCMVSIAGSVNYEMNKSGPCLIEVLSRHLPGGT
jgi:hypothetical protein